MSGEVDELFGDGAGAPQPRIRTVLALLGAGLLVAVPGLACTVVPGALLVLFAWVVVEKEMDRVDTGFLSVDHRAEVVRLRNVVRGTVVVLVMLIFAQFVLLTYTPLYDALLRGLLMSLGATFEGSPPPA